MKNKKCIERECKFYFQSDHIERCGLTGLYLTRDRKRSNDCLNHLMSKKEEIICKVSALTDEINYLDGLIRRME